MTSGVDIRSHIARSAKRVPNGTAPEDFWPQMKRLRMKKMAKTKPGNTSAVKSEFCFHLHTLAA